MPKLLINAGEKDTTRVKPGTIWQETYDDVSDPKAFTSSWHRPSRRPW
jgi:hypothetical protein